MFTTPFYPIGSARYSGAVPDNGRPQFRKTIDAATKPNAPFGEIFIRQTQ